LEFFPNLKLKTLQYVDVILKNNKVNNNLIEKIPRTGIGDMLRS